MRHEARIDSRGKVKVGQIILDIVPNILKAVILLIRRLLHPPPSNIMSGTLVSLPPIPGGQDAGSDRCLGHQLGLGLPLPGHPGPTYCLAPLRFFMS